MHARAWHTEAWHAFLRMDGREGANKDQGSHSSPTVLLGAPATSNKLGQSFTDLGVAACSLLDTCCEQLALHGQQHRHIQSTGQLWLAMGRLQATAPRSSEPWPGSLLPVGAYAPWGRW